MAEMMMEEREISVVGEEEKEAGDDATHQRWDLSKRWSRTRDLGRERSL